MVSIREAVFIDGVLRGMDFEAHCRVKAIRVSLPRLDTWEYVGADITHAPPELPDGTYEVSFEGRTMKVKKAAGAWIGGLI